MNVLIQTIDGIQEILAICPCCGDLFRLVEGKFIFPEKPLRKSEYTELTALEERVSTEDERLSSAEERFREKLNEQRESLVAEGRKKAKKRLKKIDPTFSGKNIDPQDVKVIFDPVEYLIFHGLNSEDGVEHVEFISRSPDSRAREAIVNSIDATIRKGAVEFETLRMKEDGSFETKKA